MKLYKHAQMLNVVRLCSDMLAVLISWTCAYFLRFDSGLISLPLGDDSFQNYLKLSPVLLGVYGLCFLASGLYGRLLNFRRIWEENFDIIRSHLFSFFVFVTMLFFLYEHRYSRWTLFLFLALTPIVIALFRSFVRKANRVWMSHSQQKTRVVVIGDSPIAKELEQKVRLNPNWNAKVADSCTHDQASEMVPRWIQDSSADVFLFVGELNAMALNGSMGSIFATSVADVIVVPDLGNISLLSPRTFELSGLAAIALNASDLSTTEKTLKRFFDIAFSLSFILLFSPVFLICAFLVKISSKGPILYRQERMGLDGKSFQCLKFRGMYTDAEDKSGPVWAKKSDDRVTPIGRWLRRTSLDEIPQFLNVLKGDMTVVGPRPERPVFVEKFKEHIPGYMLRHKMKAGITGWAQINGWRGDTSLEKRIECDLWYVQNWSIWLDIKICLLTPIKGLIHPNAY